MTPYHRSWFGAIFCIVCGLGFCKFALSQSWMYERHTALMCLVFGLVFFVIGLLVTIHLLRGRNISERALNAMGDEALLGRWATWKLTARGETGMEQADTMLKQRGIVPEQWQTILQPAANVPVECNCVFGKVALAKFGLQEMAVADIRGEGKLRIQDNVISIEGRRALTFGDRMGGLLLSLLVGAISFVLCGLIMGTITGSGFGIVVGGSTFVVFRWWNFAKGEVVNLTAQIPERTIIYNRWQQGFCLELENGAWVSFRMQSCKSKTPISALAILGCLFGDRFQTVAK